MIWWINLLRHYNFKKNAFNQKYKNLAVKENYNIKFYTNFKL